MDEVSGPLPFTDDDYELLLHHRKAFIRTAGTPQEAPFTELCQRFHAAYPSTPQRLAYHEAGHVVMAHCLGLHVIDVRRLSNDHWETLSTVERDNVEHWCLMNVAGHLSEAHAC